jgi:hypothetical protein
LGVIRDPEKNQLIDLGVINERIGLFGAAKAGGGERKTAF